MINAGTIKKPRRAVALTALLVVIAAVTILAIFFSSIKTDINGGSLSSRAESYTYVVANPDDAKRSSNVVVINRAGEIVKTIPTLYQPDVIINEEASRVYIAETDVLSGPHTDRLSIVDPRTWQVIKSTKFTDRLLYTVRGPSTMVLSPDKDRLLIYKYRIRDIDVADYWLSVYDASDLSDLGLEIPIRDCGGASLKPVSQFVVILCSEGQKAHFINPQTGAIVASVPTSDTPMGWAVSPDQQSIYVVLPDLRIEEISVSMHKVIRTEDKYQQPWRVLPSLHSVSLSPDGKSLLVGVGGKDGDTTALSIHQFALPSLELIKVMPTNGYEGFVSSNGNVYLLPHVGQAQATILSLDTGQKDKSIPLSQPSRIAP
jgi:DNA-binding beta-propeller fold protein YncE